MCPAGGRGIVILSLGWTGLLTDLARARKRGLSYGRALFPGDLTPRGIRTDWIKGITDETSVRPFGEALTVNLAVKANDKPLFFSSLL